MLQSYPIAFEIFNRLKIESQPRLTAQAPKIDTSSWLMHSTILFLFDSPPAPSRFRFRFAACYKAARGGSKTDLPAFRKNLDHSLISSIVIHSWKLPAFNYC